MRGAHGVPVPVRSRSGPDVDGAQVGAGEPIGRRPVTPGDLDEGAGRVAGTLDTLVVPTPVVGACVPAPSAVTATASTTCSIRHIVAGRQRLRRAPRARTPLADGPSASGRLRADTRPAAGTHLTAG